MLTVIRKLCAHRSLSFYAVRVGRQPGIYHTWQECREQITGYPEAAYKKFDTKDDAQEFVVGRHSVLPPSCMNEFGIENDPSLEAEEDYIKNQQLKIEEEDYYGDTKEFNYYGDTFKHQIIERENLPKSPVVYTDGCCLKKDNQGIGGGIGVYWAPHHPMNVSEPLHIQYPTSQKAELIAAYRALEIALEMGLTSIELRTDSIYTIKSMTVWIQRWEENGWKNSKGGNVQNAELMKRLAELCNKISITWVHVHGHKGIYGNEEADRLANEGAMKENLK